MRSDPCRSTRDRPGRGKRLRRGDLSEPFLLCSPAMSSIVAMLLAADVTANGGFAASVPSGLERFIRRGSDVELAGGLAFEGRGQGHELDGTFVALPGPFSVGRSCAHFAQRHLRGAVLRSVKTIDGGCRVQLGHRDGGVMTEQLMWLVPLTDSRAVILLCDDLRNLSKTFAACDAIAKSIRAQASSATIAPSSASSR
jgi:hypothetical protein